MKKKKSRAKALKKNIKKPLSREDRVKLEKADGQRHEFERDRDRVLYSSEFRRLAGVTQVVHVEEGHVYHNRLTHSLKVAQIARRLAEHLLKITQKNSIEKAGGLDPNVAEAAALLHDIGHPPFGHISEDELNKLLLEKNCDDGFEGNAQSFRIACALSIRSSDVGLNLTRASLNAILKYPWPHSNIGKASKKWGFYNSERAYFDFARAMEVSGSTEKSLEAEIMDYADDIAYSVHDVDDFYRAGLIPFEQLLMETNEREKFIDFALKNMKEKNNKLKFTKKDAESFLNHLNSLTPELREPFRGTRAQRKALASLTTILIRRYIFGPNPKPFQIAKKKSGPKVTIHPKIDAEIKLLKEVMRYYVFINPALLGQQLGQRKIISDLFSILHDAVSVGKGCSIIPMPFQEYFNDTTADPQRARLIADFIASLTEQQAINLHRRLTGVAPGSVRELIAR